MSETTLRHQTLRCLDCEHVVSGMSYRALKDALEAHVEHVNARADRETDDHFAEHRLDRLIAI